MPHRIFPPPGRSGCCSILTAFFLACSFYDPLHAAGIYRLRLIACIQIAGQTVHIHQNVAACPYVTNFAGCNKAADTIHSKPGGAGGFLYGSHAGECNSLTHCLLHLLSVPARRLLLHAQLASPNNAGCIHELCRGFSLASFGYIPFDGQVHLCLIFPYRHPFIILEDSVFLWYHYTRQ